MQTHSKNVASLSIVKMQKIEELVISYLNAEIEIQIVGSSHTLGLLFYSIITSSLGTLSSHRVLSTTLNRNNYDFCIILAMLYRLRLGIVPVVLKI